MGTEVLAVDPIRPDVVALERVADRLRAGRLVAFPTETFYGLGAAALDPHATRRIFAVKGRPESKPLLVLVDSVLMAETVALVSTQARTLMERYWPGPLTLVLPARASVPEAVTSGTGTVGVRLSSHPTAQGLVRILGAPVTAPSANPTGAAPPTTAAEVLRYFPDALACVLDGGSTAGGPPSTVLDLTADPPRLLRQGAATVPL